MVKFCQKKKKHFNTKDIIKLLKLEGLINRYPYNLSGGEKQRVAIGRALFVSTKTNYNG